MKPALWLGAWLAVAAPLAAANADAPREMSAALPPSSADTFASTDDQGGAQGPSGREVSDDTSDLLGLLDQSVVSTASKAAESASAAPATSVSISADDLHRYGIHSLDEAINFLSLGMVTQNPLHSVDVGARGVLLTADFGNHVLLLLNGHALNEQWGGTAYFERGAAVPFELIDHIEIILGPGSVLYGSNAMLGVINIVTKRAKDFQGLHLAVDAEGLHAYTGDLLTAGRIALGYGKSFELWGRPAEITGQIEYYKQAGPGFTFGPQNYGNDAITGAPKQFNADGSNPGVWGGKADQSFYTHVPAGYGRLVVGDVQLEARAASYKRATPYLNYFNQAFGDFNDGQSYELDQWIDLELKHHKVLSAIADLNWRLYGDYYRFLQMENISAAEDCDAGLPRCTRQTVGQSRWAGLEAQLSFDWLSDTRLVTLFGVDGRLRHILGGYDVVDPVTAESRLAFGHFAVYERTAGLYLEQKARPWEALDLSVGLRFDADQRFGAHFSPRAAAVLHPWAGGALKAIYSEAFRAPSAFETYFVAPGVQIQAEGLRPEVVRSVEALVEQRHGAQRWLLGAFYSRWTDLIVLQALADDDPAVLRAKQDGALAPSDTGIVQSRNSSSIANYGVDAALEGSLGGGTLRYGLNLTLAKARRDGTDDPLPVAPQLYGNARISYEPRGLLPRLGLIASYVARRPADRAFDGGFAPVPYAPAQLELRATAWGPLPWARGLSYQLGINWAASSVGPYVAGPIQAATEAQPSAELVPVDRFRAMLGLHLDL